MTTRKLPEYFDDPVDNFILLTTDPLIPSLNKLNITPNMITTMSLICSIGSSHCITIYNWEIASVLNIISYALDCMDGPLARRFNMLSKFGDWYDHISDYFGIILLFRSLYHIKAQYFKQFIIGSGLFWIGTSYHYSAQQLYSNHSSDSLDILKSLVGTKENAIKIMPYTRFFGTGIYTLFVSFYLLSQKNCSNIKCL